MNEFRLLIIAINLIAIIALIIILKRKKKTFKEIFNSVEADSWLRNIKVVLSISFIVFCFLYALFIKH